MKTYHINRSKIIYEILQTDVIAINFETGDYYNLIHVAKQIWQLIELETPVSQIISLISNHYGLEHDVVFSDVQCYINQLLENGLIIPSDNNDIHTNSAEVISHHLQYTAPQLMKYSDIQDLLLLDPIHEVSESGWPEKVENGVK